MKLVTVFFDLEGWWEVPYRERFDLTNGVKKILNILNKHKIKAVFNTSAIVLEKFPKLIEHLHSEGNEISCHGYKHENFVQLKETGELSKILDKIDKLFLDVIGEKPIGMRFPWTNYNEALYSILEKKGYKWVSNKRIIRAEEIKFKSYPQIPAELIFKLLWGFYKKEPFKINNLLEIPLLSSLDASLLGLVSPTQKSSDSKLKYSFESLKNQFNESKNYFNLNFHCWLIGTGNRLILLEKILDYVSNQNCSFVLPRELLSKFK